MFRTTTAKPRLTVETMYAYVADHFAQTGNRRPSHCDVRCACNDVIDSYARDGYTVTERYSQDKAHRAVLAILRN
jgi:hypothetical protein